MNDLQLSTLHLYIDDLHLTCARYCGQPQPSFSYTTLHMQPGMSLQAQLREACAREDILQQPTQRVNVLLAGTATPVPLADFQEEHCEAIYGFCFPSNGKGKRVFYDMVPATNTVLLFALAEDTCRAIEEVFGEVHYTSALTPLLRHFSAREIHAPRKRIYANCRPGHTDVAALEGTRLVMLNSFDTQTASDIAYYTFNVAHSLGMDTATTPICLCGEPALRDEAAAELRKYTNTVTALRPAAEYNRNIVAAAEDVPYALVTLLLDQY